MAPFPLEYAVPAAVASLAYLEAKTGFGSDWAIFYALLRATRLVRAAESRDRVNGFYQLEDLVSSPQSAHRAFLAVPPVIPKEAKTPRDLDGLQCTELTYKEVYDTVLQYAAWLKHEHGIQRDDIVAMDITNKPEFVIIWYALWSLGAKPALINTNLRGEAMVHCVEAAKSRTLLIDAAIQDALTPEVQSLLADASVTTVIIDKATESQITTMQGYRAPDSERSGQRMSDVAVLIYTSGTTGLPKPAIVAWKKFFMSAKHLGNWLNVKPTERYISAMPLYHSSGTILGVSLTLHAGATFIICPRFSPRTFFASATASNATMMQYIGEMCRYLVAMPPSEFDTSHNVRLALGNGLRPDVWSVFKDRFQITEIAEFYSATEAAGATLIKSKNDFGHGAVGRVGSFLKLFMGSGLATVKHDHETGEPWRDPKTGLCQRVEVGEMGEMLNKLDPTNIADKYVGYFGNEKATNEKILRDVLEKGDYWYRTGDLLRMDKEGRIYFLDRIGDTFRWKAENVSTNEVSEALSSNPHVDQVNVYGVELPKHDGRAGCAALMLKSEPSHDVLRALATHARTKLPRYAVPLFLRVVKGFEVTGTSKYTKHGLRTQGVDPEKTGEDQVFWLPPGADVYQKFGKRDWEGIAGGGVKL